MNRLWKIVGILVGVLVIAGLGAAITYHRWLPPARERPREAFTPHEHDKMHGGNNDGEKEVLHEHEEHNEHDEHVPNKEISETHEHGADEEKDSLVLTPQGRKNIGLTLTTVALRDFQRTISVPATIIERAGRTQLTVSAPMTGIVVRIYPLQGEAVLPGDPLFDLRLTHEDLVEKQSSLLRLLGERDVIRRELARLEQVTASGAVAGKRLLEQEYELLKLEAAIQAERQSLLLHGLSQKQIQRIDEKRELLQVLTVASPSITHDQMHAEHEAYLQVAELAVTLGEHVVTGTPLAVLNDHCVLLVEGKAFEQDADALNRAAETRADVTVLIESAEAEPRRVSGLRILYIENEIERQSRALKFYVQLPNRLVRDETTAEGRRYIGWQYKPGQRVEVLVPVERWEDRIVLPVEAVVREGAESYVYHEEDGQFHRVPVHVEYRDQHSAVLATDGSLSPGDRVVVKGAYQIHLALKNRSGAGTDPHAGHQH